MKTSHVNMRDAANAVHGTPAEGMSERDRLMRELGELLYPATKGDERFFLMAPDLYLAIARLDGEVDSSPPACQF